MNRIDQAIRDAEGAVTRVTGDITPETLIEGYRQSMPSAGNAPKAGHTPGPWQIGGLWNDNVFRQTDGFPIFICSFEHDRGQPLTEESAANAKLIAAAPDMLKEIDKLREDKQTCVLMLRALYTWLDGFAGGVYLTHPQLQKEALWRCATITETLEKVGEL